MTCKRDKFFSVSNYWIAYEFSEISFIFELELGNYSIFEEIVRYFLHFSELFLFDINKPFLTILFFSIVTNCREREQYKL